VAQTPHFRIDTTEQGTRRTIKLVGELDSATCTELASQFEQLTVTRDFSELVLDLEELSFIDSSGMRTIILIEQTARQQAIPLVVLPPPEPVSGLLQITGISDRLTLAPHLSEAPPSTGFIERIDVLLPRDPAAPRRAREEIREAMKSSLDGDDSATATLLTSELVTNAVVHAQQEEGARIGLRIISYQDRVRVEITDSGVGFDPTAPAPTRSDTGGRGLFVVDRLASRWGASRRTTGNDVGFCVWFALDMADQVAQQIGAN
jgi:serine/threonine-protein kinase RsbW